ncbi:MAG: methyltransferase [Desulfurococcaceae archaeon]
MAEPWGIVLVERVTEYLRAVHAVRRVLAFERSPYQEIAVVELEGFGKALVIDNFIQSSQLDEYLYHELLVHPAMVLHDNPRRVLILGGGEGAALREVLKHPSVEEAVMVDIDARVVELSKEHLPEIHAGSFNDPRARVLIMDGYEYVMRSQPNSFDVIVMDLTDPYAGEPAQRLYTPEFMAAAKRLLRGGGVLVTQAGNSLLYHRDYLRVRSAVASAFKHYVEYWTWVPSFSIGVNFILASDHRDPSRLSAEEFDARLRERGVRTKYINGRRYAGLVLLGPLEPPEERQREGQ